MTKKTIDCPGCKGVGKIKVDEWPERDYAPCPKCAGSGQMPTAQINAAMAEKVGWEKSTDGRIHVDLSISAAMRGKEEIAQMLEEQTQRLPMAGYPNTWDDTDTATRAGEEYRLVLERKTGAQVSLEVSLALPILAVYQKQETEGGVPLARGEGDELSHAICRAILEIEETPAGG